MFVALLRALRESLYLRIAGAMPEGKAGVGIG
jgi:hypothetical protein